MRRTTTGIVLTALCATCASGRVLADDPLGFYLGGAVGESHVRSNKSIVGDTDYEYDFDARHAAWKIAAGIRPISPLGLELEYIHFGNPSAPVRSGFGGLSAANQRAVALFGVAYLPNPVPFLDVYGKLGVARLRTTSTETPPAPLCPVGVDCFFGPLGPPSFDIADSTTNFAFGAGVQYRISGLAVRGEYERLTGSGFGPDLLSVGVTWTF